MDFPAWSVKQQREAKLGVFHSLHQQEQRTSPSCKNPECSLTQCMCCATYISSPFSPSFSQPMNTRTFFLIPLFPPHKYHFFQNITAFNQLLPWHSSKMNKCILESELHACRPKKLVALSIKLFVENSKIKNKRFSYLFLCMAVTYISSFNRNAKDKMCYHMYLKTVKINVHIYTDWWLEKMPEIKRITDFASTKSTQTFMFKCVWWLANT